MKESPRVGAVGLMLAGVVILAAMAWVPLRAAAPTLIGKSAPDFVLPAMNGPNLRLSEYRGQVVLVNFWARWEGDTHEQMRALDRINSTYQRAGLVVLGISVDEDVRRAREYAGAAAVTYPILFDTGPDLGKEYMLQKLPVTILVDRAGVVRYSSVGFKRGDERGYLDQIRELLRE